MLDYTKEVHDFVISNYLFGDGASLEDDTSFLNSGIIDSTSILELVMHLETTYGIKVGEEEMIPDNLDSVNRVAQFLTRKRANATA